MKVEIISETKQRFNGKNYWLDKSTGYYRNSYVRPHSLHRQVWIFHNGEIPAKMTIDHIDRNKDNNQIDNLRLATYSENSNNISEQERKRRREWVNKIRPKASKWHGSKSGIEWHKKHGIEAFAKRKPIKKFCAHCGKEYFTKQYSKTARFCGQNCKMKARRRRMAGLPENALDLKKKRIEF